MEASTSTLSSSKKKLYHGKKIGEGEDRISCLAENVLQYILSFLTAEYAVRTSVLSTRWKRVWIGISNLVFFGVPRTHYSIMDTLMFMNFVDNVLLHHDTTFIDKFWITSNMILDDIRVIEWISAISGCQVKEFVLKILVKDPPVLPCTLLTSISLKRMTLCVNSIFKLPDSLCISSLKILHLELITFYCDEMIHQVSLSCPILEKLILKDCFWNIKVVNIYAPALKDLIIDDHHTYNVEDNIYDSDIEVYAESLVTLDLISQFAYRFSLHDLSSLSKASIDFYSLHDIDDHVIKLIEAIGNVKDLMLSTNVISTLSDAHLTVKFLAFPNLKSLGVRISEEAYIYGADLIELFRYLPNVESLYFSFDIVYDEKEHGRVIPWPLDAIPQPFLSHLKSVELRRFDGFANELGLVEFLLKNARALKKVTVVSSSTLSENPKMQSDVLKHLLMLPRRSACRITFQSRILNGGLIKAPNSSEDAFETAEYWLAEKNYLI